MPVYTVHAPPPRRGDSVADPMRFAFVRDGFSFWAFLFGPLWMLWHRLWLVLIGYLVAVTIVQIVLVLGGAAAAVGLPVALLVAVLVGFEAASFRRWTLHRRGWRQLDVVVADDVELAERRFFDAWAAGASPAGLVPPPAAPPVSPIPPRPARPAPDVIGLFPQPGGRP